MKDIKLKSKRSKGRPAYIPDLRQLQDLFKRIDNKEITNEQGWQIARL